MWLTIDTSSCPGVVLVNFQGLVKGAIHCFRNLYCYFRHGESTSTASQLTSPASQKSKDLNKVPLLIRPCQFYCFQKLQKNPIHNSALKSAA